MSRWTNFTEGAALALMATVLLLSPSAQSRTASSRAPSVATPQAHPPPASPAPRGIQSYRRFHANDSFIGKSIPCSDEEKICFRYNTLYDPESGHCVFPPDNLHCVGDRQDFLQGSGRLHAKCPRYLDPCPGYRMAFDGRCYPKQLVRDVLCGCPAPPTAHFLGGVECRCAPPARRTVRQPTQRGRCRVPDLRFPDSSSGRLHAKCPRYQDPCPGYRMAFDGRCYPKQLVRDVLCGCPAPPTPHFLGGVECRCDPPARRTVRQPTQQGRCRVPDLRFPDSSYNDTLLRRIARWSSSRVFNLSCSPEQAKCFSQREVWVATAKGCFPLGRKGPCPDSHVVTLQKHALATTPAVCLPENGGCVNGSFRMVFDGKCHEKKQMEVVASSHFWRNVVGEFEIGFYNIRAKGVPTGENGSCSIRLTFVTRDSTTPDRQFPKLDCVRRNSGLCSVEAVPPLPD